MSNTTVAPSLTPAQATRETWKEDLSSKMTTTVFTTLVPNKQLSGGAIAGIVIGCLVFVTICGIATFFVFRYVKDRRKNHGEYRPQWEEEHHAKDLPHIQPPAIEGLI